MALTPRRHRFGASSADTTQSVGVGNAAIFEPNHVLWVYNAKTGGVRITDLSSDAAGTLPITEVVSGASGGIPEFYGPVGATDLWISSSEGAIPETNERTLIAASDLAEDIDALDAAVDGIVVSAGVDSVNGLTGVVALGPEDLVPSAALGSDLSDVQAIVGARVLQSGSGYPARPSAAQFAIFVGTADPSTAALDGDIWLQPETA